ncbi:hypothetical protein HN937_30550 [Candidatus Poribacteria bacterium]|jgi:hypothetical protein|nr:hypothetical protein [Candidatus Poribacteria bacterium]
MAATLGSPGAATPQGTAAPADSQFAEVPITRAATPERLLNLPPRPVFWYKWHPARWSVFAGEWLPQLGRLYADPGVANVSDGGGMKTAWSEANARGWHKIPHAAVRLVDEGRDTYVKAFDVRQGTGIGKHHMSIFETPKQIGSRVIIKTDEERYRSWLRALVDTGAIPAPDPDILDVQVDAQRARLERALTSSNPQRQKREQARHDEIETAVGPGEDKPAPAKKGRK